jgi:hypothetical protein
MRLLSFLFCMVSLSASAQSINNATVNIMGNTQNVIINQSGADHTTYLSFSGNGISAVINQSGSVPQSFSLSVTCGNSCPTSPYVVNQY